MWARLAAAVSLAFFAGILAPVGPMTPPAHGRGTPAGTTIPNVSAASAGNGPDTVSPSGVGISDTVVVDSGDPVWVPKTAAAFARPGETAYVQVRLVNLGNALDTIVLSGTSATFETAVRADTAGPALADTRLAADDTAVLYACVRPPAAAADATVETAVFTARSTRTVPSTDTLQVAVTVDRTPPAAPAPSGPADSAVVCGGTVGFAWAAAVDTASGTARYRLEVATSAAFSPRLVDSQTAALAETAVLPLGTYRWRVTAIDAVGNTSAVAETRTFTATACSLARFVVTPNTTAIVAGGSVVLTIEARDNLDTILTTFTGTASIAASTPPVSPSTTGTFSAGVRVETVTLTAAGLQTITVSSGSASGTTTVTVLAAPAVAFSVSAPASVVAGMPFTLSIAAVDTYGNVAAYAGTATIADSTASISPTLTGAFVGGRRTETATILVQAASDLVRVESGALRGGATLSVVASTEPRMVEAWARPSGGAAEIVIRVISETGALLPVTGDTVRVTLLEGGSDSFLPSNPIETTTVGGVAVIPWSSTADGVLRLEIVVMRLGRSETTTYSDVRLDLEMSNPVRTSAHPDGGMAQAPLTLFPDSWTLVIRPSVSSDWPMILDASAKMPPSMAMPGEETDVVREVFAVRNDGTLVTGDLGGEVTIWLRYNDADRDGIVDGTEMHSTTLRVYRLNEADEVWEVFTNSGFGADSHVRAIIDHFSFFTIVGQEGVSGLEGTVTYPNPFYPLEAGSTRGGVAQPGFVTIDTRRAGHARLKVTIRNLAGDVVRVLEAPTPGVGVPGVDLSSGLAYWDGRNAAGAVVASGLYFFTVESDLGTGRGKMTVIK